MKIFWMCLLIIQNIHAEDLPCKGRAGDVGQGQVCVCDSSYCDTVERPARLPRGQYYQYTTSNSSSGFTKTIGSFAVSTLNTNDDDDIVFAINSSVRYQEILGFGGSFTESVGVVFGYLPEDAQNKLIESYFGPSGIEYTLCRVPIGSSDFSPRPYTLDDVPDDKDLLHFNLSSDELMYKIPLIKKAMKASQRKIKLLISSWTAPAWMKTDKNVGYIQKKYFQTWANYHVKFLAAYKELGIDFWGLTGGNEGLAFLYFPINGDPPSLNLWMAHSQKHWFKDHLKPLLEASNFSDIKLLALDDQRLFAPYYMERFADDPEAYKAFDGVGLHWYMDWFIPPSFLTYMHEQYPDKLIVYTESSINFIFVAGDDKTVVLGSWDHAAAYIYNIIENFNHFTNGYIDWNLALDPEGGPNLSIPLDAAVIVNETSGEFYKQPMFYALGHFSKFIPPGSVRVHMDSNQNISSVTASNQLSTEMLDDILHPKSSEFFKDTPFPPGPPRVTVPAVVISLATANPDGSFTVVVLNSKNVTAPVRIEDQRVGSIHLYLEAHSINTFVYWLD